MAVNIFISAATGFLDTKSQHYNYNIDRLTASVTTGTSLKLSPTISSVPMDDYSYFLRKGAGITAIWQGLKLAQRSMYKIQTRTSSGR